MANSNYDDTSHDSVLSRVLTRLDQQDRTTDTNTYNMARSLEKLTDEIIKMDVRLTGLEKFRWLMAGSVITITTGIAWYLAFLQARH